MKRLIVVILFLVPFYGLSEQHSAKGQIADIMTGSDATNDLAIVYLENFTSAGSCKKYDAQNLVITTIENDEQGNAMLSLALSAYMAGKEVKLSVSDLDLDSRGYCRIQRLRLNSDF